MKNDGDGQLLERCGAGASCVQPYQCGSQYKIQSAKVRQRCVLGDVHYWVRVYTMPIQLTPTKTKSCMPFGARTFFLNVHCGIVPLIDL
jgi:hypothetical protein